MTIAQPDDSAPDEPLGSSGNRHPTLALLGCLAVAVPTGVVTTWQLAVAVFLASVALYRR